MLLLIFPLKQSKVASDRDHSFLLARGYWVKIQTKTAIWTIHVIPKTSRVRLEKGVLNGFLIRFALTS